MNSDECLICGISTHLCNSYTNYNENFIICEKCYNVYKSKRDVQESLKKMVFNIPKELKRISTNDFYSGMHWSRRKKISDEWHLIIISECHKQNIKPVSKCKLTFEWNNRYDLDNNSAMEKMVIDGLVKAKIITDDSKKYVVEKLTKSGNYDMVIIEEII